MTDVHAGLNGVDLATVGGLVDHIKSDPSSAATVWSAEVTWTGAFRSEAQVRDFAPLPSDEPAALGGGDTAPNPVEQVLAALGNCLAVGYAANASVEGITVGVAIDADATEDQLARLHERVVGTSPVGHTLSRPVPVQVELVTA